MVEVSTQDEKREGLEETTYFELAPEALDNQQIENNQLGRKSLSDQERPEAEVVTDIRYNEFEKILNTSSDVGGEDAAMPNLFELPRLGFQWWKGEEKLAEQHGIFGEFLCTTLPAATSSCKLQATND